MLMNYFKYVKKLKNLLEEKKSPKNSPRECDIDIIDYNKKKKMIKFVYLIQECIKEILYYFHYLKLNKNWKHPILKQDIKTLIFSLSNKDIRSIKQI